MAIIFFFSNKNTFFSSVFHWGNIFVNLDVGIKMKIQNFYFISVSFRKISTRGITPIAHLRFFLMANSVMLMHFFDYFSKFIHFWLSKDIKLHILLGHCLHKKRKWNLKYCSAAEPFLSVVSDNLWWWFASGFSLKSSTRYSIVLYETVRGTFGTKQFLYSRWDSTLNARMAADLATWDITKKCL